MHRSESIQQSLHQATLRIMHVTDYLLGDDLSTKLYMFLNCLIHWDERYYWYWDLYYGCRDKERMEKFREYGEALSKANEKILYDILTATQEPNA